MKNLFELTTIVLLCCCVVLQAGYKSPADGAFEGRYADGEPLGQPERRNRDHRPNLPDSPSRYPADDIPESTRDKIEQIYLAECKEANGLAAWGNVRGAELNALFDQALVDWFNNERGGNWDGLTPEQQNNLKNEARQDAFIDFFLARARQAFLCSEWERLAENVREARLNEKKDADLKIILGEEAFDGLDDEEKQAERDNLAATRIEIMRCNLETALKMIECVCPEVADCLREAWDKGRLCVDFNSPNARGRMAVHPDGKDEGECDPDSFPINIAVNTFPKRKAQSCFDPELYQMFSTLLHEGVHGIQEIAPSVDAPNAEQCADFELQRVRLERGAYAKQNKVNDELCGPLLGLLAGGVPGETGAALADKIADKIAEFPQPVRQALAGALKGAVLVNKARNDGSLEYYDALEELAKKLKDGEITKQQFGARRSALREVVITHEPDEMRTVVMRSGAGTNVIKQTMVDRESGESAQQDFMVPVDAITESLLIHQGQFLITFGNDDETGDGVVHAFQDQNGDGFFDPETGQEIMRQFEFFGAIDANFTEIDECFRAVNLVSGEIFKLIPSEEQPLPNQFAPCGVMDFQDHSMTSVIFSPDHGLYIASPHLPFPEAPFHLPGEILPMSVMADVDLFLQVIPLEPLQLPIQSDFMPVFVAANGLPVLRTTSTINTMTDQLELSALGGSFLEVFLLPGQSELPVLLGGVEVGPDNRGALNFTQALAVGDQLIILNPETGMESVPYFVQDPAPILIDPVFIPGEGLQVSLIGIPGMAYQLLGSAGLIDPLPLGDPLIAQDGAFLIPPDPSLGGDRLFLQAVTLPEQEGR